MPEITQEFTFSNDTSLYYNTSSIDNLDLDLSAETAKSQLFQSSTCSIPGHVYQCLLWVPKSKLAIFLPPGNIYTCDEEHFQCLLFPFC